MKKLKAFIVKKLSTLSVNMSQTPVLMTIAIFVVLNALFLLAAAGVAVALDTDGSMFYDSIFPAYIAALVEVSRWLVAPNSLALLDVSGAMQMLATVVVMVGMVLFGGTIVAVLTTWLRTYVMKKAEAKGKLHISKHVVILNYNNKVTSILTDLMFSEDKHTVLILSDKNREEVKAELNAELATLLEKPKHKLKLIVRQGNPNSMAELNDIGISKATGILIMDNNQKSAYSNMSSVGDYNILKLVMRLSAKDIPASCPIGIECNSDETKDTILRLMQNVDGLKDKSIQVFSNNKKLGKFLALSILCPELAGVMKELLSFANCEFYAGENLTIDEYLQNYSECLPALNIKNRTFLLAENKSSTTKVRLEPFKTEKLLKANCVETNFSTRSEGLKLFLIGESTKCSYMMNALKAEESEIEIRRYEAGDIKNFAKDLAEFGDELTTALILSDESVSLKDYDSNVFLTLMELSCLIDLKSRKFKIVAEILEPDNQQSLEEFNITNIIVSTRIVSFFATKLLLDPISELFYEEIFTNSLKNDTCKLNLWISEAKDVFDLSENLTFSSYSEFVHAAYYGSNKKRMPIGITKDDKNTYFCVEMDTEREFKLNETDKVIYLEYLQI